MHEDISKLPEVAQAFTKLFHILESHKIRLRAERVLSDDDFWLTARKEFSNCSLRIEAVLRFLAQNIGYVGSEEWTLHTRGWASCHLEFCFGDEGAVVSLEVEYASEREGWVARHILYWNDEDLEEEPLPKPFVLVFDRLAKHFGLEVDPAGNDGKERELHESAALEIVSALASCFISYEQKLG